MNRPDEAGFLRIVSEGGPQLRDEDMQAGRAHVRVGPQGRVEARARERPGPRADEEHEQLEGLRAERDLAAVPEERPGFFVEMEVAEREGHASSALLQVRIAIP